MNKIPKPQLSFHSIMSPRNAINYQAQLKPLNKQKSIQQRQDSLKSATFIKIQPQLIEETDENNQIQLKLQFKNCISDVQAIDQSLYNDYPKKTSRTSVIHSDMNQASQTPTSKPRLKILQLNLNRMSARKATFK